MMKNKISITVLKELKNWGEIVEYIKRFYFKVVLVIDTENKRDKDNYSLQCNL